MSLIRWQPLKELDALRHQINQLFDELMHGDREFEQFSKIDDTTWSPAIELKETDTELILRAAVPGLEAKDLDVQVSEHGVSITGEHREEKRAEEKGYFRSELHYGRFQRMISLPVPIKHEQVDASFRNGILTLTLPKAEVTQKNVTKIDLTTQEKARESIAQQRQHDQRLQEKMRARAISEMETTGHATTQEEARELVTEQRRHNDHLQETMHKRAADEISTSTNL